VNELNISRTSVQRIAERFCCAGTVRNAKKRLSPVRKVENSVLNVSFRIKSSFVGRLGSGMWISASFQSWYIVHAVFIALTYVYAVYSDCGNAPGSLVVKCWLYDATRSGSILARADFLLLLFSYFLHFSFYCNMQLIQFKVYCNQHLHYIIMLNKKLNCRRETTGCFVSLNTSLSHSRSFEMSLLRA